MAGALLDQTFKGHAEAFSAVQSGASSPAASPGFAREGQELMAQLLRFTAKTPQGKQAAASLTAFSENQTNRLVGALRGSLPQGANTAFELLVKNKKFTRLEPQTRFALLSQINNYRDNNRITEVIENLGRLARQPWFVGSLLAHQQLSAQIVAFDSQYDGSKNIRYKLEPILQGDGKKILRHTLDLILDERGNTKLVWTNLGPVVSGTGDDSTNQVELNYNLMQPGNVKLAGERPIDVATDTLPHEANHVVNHISRTPVGSCLRMIHELYAAGVGYEATTYNKLNEQAAYNYIRNNFFSGKPPYTDLAAIIWYNGNDKSKEAESAKIARVIATMLGKDPKSGEYRIGKDPSQATNRDIILFDRKFEKNPDILSKSEPALIPKDIDGAPLNLSLDNRVGP